MVDTRIHHWRTNTDVLNAMSIAPPLGRPTVEVDASANH